MSSSLLDLCFVESIIWMLLSLCVLFLCSAYPSVVLVLDCIVSSVPECVDL